MGEADSLVSQAELSRRWGVSSRTVNRRLVFLGITPQRRGRHHYLTPEQVALAERFHQQRIVLTAILFVGLTSHTGFIHLHHAWSQGGFIGGHAGTDALLPEPGCPGIESCITGQLSTVNRTGFSWQSPSSQRPETH